MTYENPPENEDLVTQDVDYNFYDDPEFFPVCEQKSISQWFDKNIEPLVDSHDTAWGKAKFEAMINSKTENIR